jgi:nicotinate-nucleotide adenylyltransferase
MLIRLPKPSYTINTQYLSEKFPQHGFVIIMGTDNLEILNMEEYGQILSSYEICVSPIVL